MANVEITLEQLRNAILQLPEEQRRELLLEVERGPTEELARPDAPRPHSILDIPPVSEALGSGRASARRTALPGKKQVQWEEGPAFHPEISGPR